MLVLDVAESTMPARYLNFRCSLPWLLLLLQTLCLIYCFFGFPEPGDVYPHLYPGKAGILLGMIPVLRGDTQHRSASIYILYLYL